MASSLLLNRIKAGAIQVVTFIAMAALLSACGDNGFKVTTQFASSKGLDVGEPVMYEGQQIGVLADFTEGANGTAVELSLDPQHLSMLHTKSVVVVNTMEQGSPIEIYNRTTTDPVPLTKGQELQGLDSMFELGAWMVGDAIQLGSGTLSDLFDSFTGYLEGDQFEDDKQEVQKQLSNAALAAKQAVESVEVDLNQALEELRVSEGEMSAAIEQMGDDLSPAVQELSASGGELIAQLEQFAQNVGTQVQENPQLGEELLQSLVNVFDQLNAQVNGQITIDTEEGPRSYELHSGQADSVQEVTPQTEPEVTQPTQDIQQ